MQITKGNTFYVLNSKARIIDLIISKMNYTMSGNGQVMVSWEDIISWLDEYHENCDIRTTEVTKEDEELGQFLNKVEQSIKSGVGDIVFCA